MTLKLRVFLWCLLANSAICCLDDAEGSCKFFKETRPDELSSRQEIISLTDEPPPRPEALSMLVEEDHSDLKSVTEEPKGRALEFTTEHSRNASLQRSIDLSDVSMDEENDQEMEDEVKRAKILAPKIATDICVQGGLTYDKGEKLEVGCDSICTCQNGKMNCTDRCSKPFFKKGKKIDDPSCFEKVTDDHCCSIMVCEADTETEPVEMCSYKNQTYHRGEKFKDGCESLCSCDVAGEVSCKARCPPVNKTSDRCVEVPDPLDSCCKTVLCDVTLNDHELDKDEGHKLKIVSATFVNNTDIKLEFDSAIDKNDSLPEIEISSDKSHWKTLKTLPGGYLKGLDGASKYLKIENSNDVIEVESKEQKFPKKTCEHKGKAYNKGEEFHDNCTSLCICNENGVNCLDLKCPTYFGVDILDPTCLEWETEPPNFVPSPPNCCATTIKCKNNGSCLHEGVMYANWQQLPYNVTGCEKRCFCEMGKIECQNSCPPVTALPPAHLACHPSDAILGHLPDDDCCRYWVCKEPDLEQGHALNRTEDDDITEKLKDKTTDYPFLGPFAVQPAKQPSKILGPLVIYTNQESGNATNTSIIKENSHYSPNITQDENHYYLKNSSENKKAEVPHKAFKPTNDTFKKPDIYEPSMPFLGPFNPNYKDSKFNKQQKPSEKPLKPSKSTPVTPSSQQNYFSGQPAANEAYVPATPGNSHIHIHGKGDPEELLQIIQQHPEFTNYPSGSVLEIHSVPNDYKPSGPPFINPNNQKVPFPGQSHSPFENSLQQGVSLEQILQHIHRGGNPQNPFAPFPQQYPPSGHDQFFVPAQSGLVLPNKLKNVSNSGGPMFPGGFPNVPPYQQAQEDIVVQNLDVIDAHRVKLSFMVPTLIVGLHGRVEVRYTHKNDDDVNSWDSQVFAPPSDLIATSHLEFDLVGLEANKEYKIKITVILRDLHNKPSSRVYTIKTPQEIATTTMPAMIPIDPNLVITDINSTWLTIVWRKFIDKELQFIDGVQLRYKEIDGKIYEATPLIHRAVTSYTLENLKPNTNYELGIFFIPFPGQVTELETEHMLHFTTTNETDIYGFGVTLNITQIKPTNVEIRWAGVPYPEDKYVNIYRAIYQSDSGKEDFSTFKIAKRDSPAKTTITDLKPGTRYRLWLEVYLTNGKIKTSNVQDFITKPRTALPLGASSQQGSLESLELPDHKGDYYGPLVIVAILAAIAILATLILLLILVRRHSQNKAAITPPSRVSQSAYDNPTYKVEIQQETMDL